MASKIKVVFQNLEMPGVRLDFTYQGVGYNLEHNKEVTLPIEVVEHLNGLQVPDPYWEEDPETGQIKHKTRMRNRFNCRIVNLAALLERAKGGRPPKAKTEEEAEAEAESEPSS